LDQRISHCSALGIRAAYFFLHDGGTKDLLRAIQAHQSGSNFTRDASEANGVIQKFNGLTENQKQDSLNFLRSLERFADCRQ